jgi:hypothetical protein
MAFEMRARHPLAHLVHTQEPPEAEFSDPRCGAMGTYRDHTNPEQPQSAPDASTDCEVECDRAQRHDGPHMTTPRNMPTPAWKRWATYEWADPDATEPLAGSTPSEIRGYAP